jgi:hypothetical protein
LVALGNVIQFLSAFGWEQHKRNKASMVSKSAAEHFVVLTGQQAPDSIEERRAG